MIAYTRSGLPASVTRLPRDYCGGLWHWKGLIQNEDGTLNGPHLWRRSGQWLETAQEHGLDLVRGLSLTAAARDEDHQRKETA